ncbi:PepSY-associated TM helix domain-containing protein, partial [Caulobacter sp. 17J65-9]|uniref:PepSY-associated TM helix domain-containing protein n=1 Tax=Caulobacter sp. 17J65-9 TaxID=2709382 RepID=UPI0013C6F85A
MARRGDLRRVWFQVHLWIGVLLSAVLIPLSLSGALLVWHDWTDAIANPQRYNTSAEAASLPPSAYAQAARAVLKPDERIAAIELPDHAASPVVVTAAGKPVKGARPGSAPRPTVWLDPATARVLDQGDANTGVLRVLHVFHGTLNIPEVGRKVVGWFGWAMLTSALTGLWLWWPRNGAFLKGLRWTRGPLFTGNLHHLVGFWICIPLATLAFTGAYISFPQTMKAAVAPLVGEAPAKGGPAQAGPRGRARPVAETKL